MSSSVEHDAPDANSAKEYIGTLVRRERTRRRSFARRPPTETWTRSSSVIAKLKTLGMLGDGIEVAVQVLMGYVDAKRRKGRSEEGVVRRLEALQRATPPSLSDAFLLARAQCSLPLPPSHSDCLPHGIVAKPTPAEIDAPAERVMIPGPSKSFRLSSVFSPSRDLPLQPGPLPFSTAPMNDRAQSKTPTGTLRMSSVSPHVRARSLSMSGFLPFALDPPEKAGPDPDCALTDWNDDLDLGALDDFPLPPTHLPTPAPTPSRKTTREVSTSLAYPAASSPSAWSIGSSSSDEMPVTPGPRGGEARWRWSGQGDDDDSSTITGVRVSSNERDLASRRAMDLHADDVFLVGLSTFKTDDPNNGRSFGFAV